MHKLLPKPFVSNRSESCGMAPYFSAYQPHWNFTSCRGLGLTITQM